MDDSSSLRTGEQGPGRREGSEGREETEFSSSALLHFEFFFNLVQSILIIRRFHTYEFAYWLKSICNTKINTCML